MTRLFACLLLLMCCTVQLYARQAVSFRFTNQYETPVKEVTILNGTETNTYQPDAKGELKVDLDLDQTISVSAKDHQQQVISVTAPNEVFNVVLQKNFTWKDILNPVFYIVNGGLWMILFIIFAETGLFVGFFLPGDSLLFVAGIYSRELSDALFPGTPFFFIMLMVTIAGILGNMVGYWFGRKSGPYLFQRKDTFFFKKKHLFTAKEFYEKNGAGAIIIARFLPIVRTFAPIVAGIVKMDRKKFMLYNIIGCVAWVFSMMLAGHYLNKIFPELKHRLELIVIVIVLITTLPVLYKFFIKKDKKGVQADV